MLIEQTDTAYILQVGKATLTMTNLTGWQGRFRSMLRDARRNKPTGTLTVYANPAMAALLKNTPGEYGFDKRYGKLNNLDLDLEVKDFEPGF